MGESKDLQEYLNGNVVNFSIIRRTELSKGIDSDRSYATWVPCSYLKVQAHSVFLNVQKLCSCFLSFGYLAVAILNNFMELVTEF